MMQIEKLFKRCPYPTTASLTLGEQCVVVIENLGGRERFGSSPDTPVVIDIPMCHHDCMESGLLPDQKICQDVDLAGWTVYD
jgi:hypothetical protein